MANPTSARLDLVGGEPAHSSKYNWWRSGPERRGRDGPAPHVQDLAVDGAAHPPPPGITRRPRGGGSGG
jgi:hypothetical protein